MFADRYDRRKLVVALDLSRGALMVALAFLTSTGSPGAVLAIVVVSYVLAAPYRPALTAGIPLIVGLAVVAIGHQSDEAPAKTA